MHKSFWILSSLLAASCAAAWWVCGQASVSIEDAPQGGIVGVAGEEATGPAVEFDAAEASTSRSAASDVEEASSQPEEGERRTSLEDAFVKVRVLRKGRPVVGAEVRYLDYERYKTLRAKHKELSSLHTAEWAERFGRKTRTRAGGWAGLPEFQSRLYVVAMHENGFAYKYVRNRNSRFNRWSNLVIRSSTGLPLRLKGRSESGLPGQDAKPAPKVKKPPAIKVDLALVPDRHIAIDVLDAKAKPVKGLQVSVYQYWPKRKRSRLILKPTTDAAGRANIRHFQLHDTDRQANWLATPLVLCETQPYVLFEHGASNARIDVEGKATKVKPLALRLPPMGRVAVRILGPRKTPMRSAARVSLTALNRITIGKVKFSQLSVSKSRSAGTEDVVFDRVGVHNKVRVEARVDRLRARKNVDTPKVAGGQRLVKLTFVGRSTVLRGRLLTTGVRPARDADQQRAIDLRPHAQARRRWRF